MKLYVARHGETTWNRERKICGRTDVPLTERGLLQARELAERVSGLHIDAILASPLQRAQDTAACVGERLGLPVLTEERLIEQSYGGFEGLDYEAGSLERHGWQFASRFRGGGESMMQLAQRIYNLLDEIREESDRKTFILVAHNGIARVVQSYFHEMTNAEYAAFGVKNCALLRYEFEN